MRSPFCVIAMLLLLVGCGYFDDSEDAPNLVIDSTPVALPVDADWELIATLQRNQLEPAMFYISEEHNEAISTAYEAGKHFIFEIGGEFNEGRTDMVRHYIIHPEVPFQDQHKDPYRVREEKREGTKWHIHTYTFLSQGWYVTEEDLVGQKGIGLGVDLSLFHFDWPQEGPFPAIKGTNYGNRIGVMDSTHVIGRSNSVINEWIRLRIYVSR